MNAIELAKRIDHTCVKPDATKDDIRKLCREALEYNFRAVSVNLSYIPLVYELLKNSGIKIGSTIGFPFGSTSIKSKVSELKEAIRLGADELDAVINIGYLKSNDLDYLRKEVISIVEMAKSFGNITVKILIETGYLTKEEITAIANIVKEAGADYIKTSTGFLTRGATLDDIRLLKSILNNEVKIKASGGIHTYQKAIEMINAGADIIGSSHGVDIIKGIRS
jgi:deoxyribose-phosphate aldolase